jgi:hypothetical protein
VRKGNRVRSAEKQTPITPLATSQFRARGPNGYGRISLTQDPSVSLQYAGELIVAFIERAGGNVGGEISTGSVPHGLAPVYVHRQSPAVTVSALRAKPRPHTSFKERRACNLGKQCPIYSVLGLYDCLVLVRRVKVASSKHRKIGASWMTACPLCFDPSSNLNQTVNFLQCLSCDLGLGKAARRIH